jgi:hypothetical protein
MLARFVHIQDTADHWFSGAEDLKRKADLYTIHSSSALWITWLSAATNGQLWPGGVALVPFCVNSCGL